MLEVPNMCHTCGRPIFIFNNLTCMILKSISWLMTSTAQPPSRYEKPPRRNVTKSVAVSQANLSQIPKK